MAAVFLDRASSSFDRRASLFSTKRCKREGETVIKNVSILLLDRYTRSVNLKNANIYVTGWRRFITLL